MSGSSKLENHSHIPKKYNKENVSPSALINNFVKCKGMDMLFLFIKELFYYDNIN